MIGHPLLDFNTLIRPSRAGGGPTPPRNSSHARLMNPRSALCGAGIFFGEVLAMGFSKLKALIHPEVYQSVLKELAHLN